MTLAEYQAAAKKTALYPNMGNNLTYPTLGLAGEAGEVANKVKKIIRDANGVLDDERRQAIAAEVGDVLWYVAQMATELGVTLDDVALHNIEKLAARYQQGKISGSGDNR